MSGLFGDDELKNEPLHDKTQSVFKPRVLTSKEYLDALEKKRIEANEKGDFITYGISHEWHLKNKISD